MPNFQQKKVFFTSIALSPLSSARVKDFIVFSGTFGTSFTPL